MLVDRCKEVIERRLAAEGALAGVEVLLELVAELVHVTRDRHRGRIAERAEALAEDAVAHVEQEVELVLVGAAVVDLPQDLHHPARTLAARRALPAGLVHVELRHAQPQLHHAAAVVDRDHRARTEQRPRRSERVEVERRVDLVGGQHRNRRASWDDRLQLASARDPAADVVDQLAQRRPVRELVVASLHDVAAERDHARAGRVLDADLRVLVPAELEHLRDGRDRLDVVDQRRGRVEPRDRRERRLRARLAALALERLEQRGLLAADVGAGAAVQDDRHFAEQPRLARLGERVSHDLELGQVLAADIDEDVLRLDRVRRDQAALDQPVRDAQHDLAVLERPRLRLVGVHGDVDRLGNLVRRGDEARFAPRREERTAAAAQIRLDEQLGHLVRRQRASASCDDGR